MVKLFARALLIGIAVWTGIGIAFMTAAQVNTGSNAEVVFEQTKK